MSMRILICNLMGVRAAGICCLLLAGGAGGLAADDKAPGTPVLSLDATRTPPAWAPGWSVARLRIPKGCDIQDAYAELLTPGGRAVTLTAHEPSKEGVYIEQIEWEGSPVKARVLLRKGNETAAIFVEPSRIAKDETLARKPPFIGFDVTFIEMPEALARTYQAPKEMRTNQVPKNMAAPIDALLFQSVLKEAPALDTAAGSNSMPSLAGVLTASQVQELLSKLALEKGVKIERRPQATARDSEHTTVRCIRDASAEAKAKGKSKAMPSGSQGMLLDLGATAGADGTLDISVVPQFVEYAGVNAGGADPEALGALVFSTRKVTTSVLVFQGQSIVLAGRIVGPKDAAAKPVGSANVLMVMVTASILPPPGPPQ